MSYEANATEMLTRYMAIRLILDEGAFPSAPTADGQSQNVKTIFANSDINSLTVEADITLASGLEPNSAYITIFGMTIEDCNQFSRFNQLFPAQLYANTVEVYAGYTVDSSGLPPLVFKGQVYRAAPDFSNENRRFVIESYSGIYNQNLIASATNPSGDVPLNTLFQGIVQKSPDDITYNANNVTGTTNCPLYMGSWINQLQMACNDYGYQMKLVNNEVYISPKGTPYVNDILTLSMDNGMLGSPMLVDLGVDVRCRFNPAIKFGQQITIQSIYQSKANGTWWINGYSHTLQNRGAKWESKLKLNPTKFNLPVTE